MLQDGKQISFLYSVTHNASTANVPNHKYISAMSNNCCHWPHRRHRSAAVVASVVAVCRQSECKTPHKTNTGGQNCEHIVGAATQTGAVRISARHGLHNRIEFPRVFSVCVCASNARRRCTTTTTTGRRYKLPLNSNKYSYERAPRRARAQRKECSHRGAQRKHNQQTKQKMHTPSNNRASE